MIFDDYGRGAIMIVIKSNYAIELVTSRSLPYIQAANCTNCMVARVMSSIFNLHALVTTHANTHTPCN